jgi:hypothetical protein
MAVGDVTGDGALDVIVASQDHSSVEVLINVTPQQSSTLSQ